MRRHFFDIDRALADQSGGFAVAATGRARIDLRQHAYRVHTRLDIEHCPIEGVSRLGILEQIDVFRIAQRRGQILGAAAQANLTVVRRIGFGRTTAGKRRYRDFCSRSIRAVLLCLWALMRAI